MNMFVLDERRTQMLRWIQKLIEDVPADWTPNLTPMRPGEKLLGPIPSEIVPEFRAVTHLGRELQRMEKEHIVSHTNGASHSLAACEQHRVTVATMLHRAELLASDIHEALRDHFGEAEDSGLDIRTEGVVLIPPRPVELDPIEEILESLRNSGIGVQVLRLNRNPE